MKNKYNSKTKLTLNSHTISEIVIKYLNTRSDQLRKSDRCLGAKWILGKSQDDLALKIYFYDDHLEEEFENED